MDMHRRWGIDFFGDEMKRFFLPCLAAAILCLLLWQGTATAQAVREGLSLCARSVIPALFPFMVVVRFSVGCGLGDILPPASAVAVIGLLSGYPMGAAAVEQFYRSGRLSRQQAAGLLCCCNQAGPAFILNYLGQTVFGSLRTGLFLWGIHLFSALVMGIFFFPPSKAVSALPAARCSPASALVAAVTQSVSAMARVCGYVVLFSVVTGLLRHFGMDAPLLLGALELTCGAGALPRTGAGFVAAAALLGWGGAAVHCQAAAVLAETDLPLGRYVAAKALQGGISAVLAALAVRWI